MSFDTVNFRLTQNEVGTVDFLSELPCHLNNVSEHTYTGGATVICGDLNGYKVSVTENSVNVKDCSLCKWFLGDNFKEMTRTDTQQAVEKLSDLLHLQMCNSTVTRMDYAKNIITRFPVEVYLSHFGALSRYTRLQQPTAVYYKQENEQIVIYDKVRQQKREGVFIPELYKNSNVLRIEQRLETAQRIKRRFGYAVRGENLFNDKFYNDLGKRLKEAYFNIKKINDVTLNFECMNTKKDLQRMGVLSLIKQVGGQNEMLAQIKEAQQSGRLTKKQAYDLRETINEVCKADQKIIVPNADILELNEKVRRAVKF